MKTPSTFLLLLLATLLGGGAMARSGKAASMTGISLHKPVRSEGRIPSSDRTPTSSVTNFGTMDFPASPASGAWGMNPAVNALAAQSATHENYGFNCEHESGWDYGGGNADSNP